MRSHTGSASPRNNFRGGTRDGFVLVPIAGFGVLRGEFPLDMFISGVALAGVPEALPAVVIISLAIIWELMLLSLLIYVPTLEEAFGTYDLPLYESLLVIGPAFSVVPVLEVAKWLVRRPGDRRTEHGPKRRGAATSSAPPAPTTPHRRLGRQTIHRYTR